MTLFLSLLLAATLTSRADVRRVQPPELHELMKKGEAVAIDVRGTVPYRHGHIAGAVWLPLGHVNQRAGELPEDKLIVAYCTCKSEETSLDAALRLSALGFTNVAVLQGGYPAWADAGLPVEAEAAPAPAPPPPAPAAASGGRLAPPDAVTCDRNKLTSFAGKVTKYSRRNGITTLTIATSADTIETVSVRHRGSKDPSRSFLIVGKRFTSADWKRIEKKPGVLRPGMSVVAWVCEVGPTVVDWRPGTTFTGAE